MESDRQLIENFFKNENQESFNLLVKRHLKNVFNFVYRYVNNFRDAEDITQEAFIKAWKNLNKFDLQRNFKVWILSIARNTALDFLKKRKPFVFSEFINEEGENILLENLEDQSPLPDKVFEDKELASKLDSILETLPSNYRAALTLRYAENLTFEEIADIFNKPMNTVKSWHRRALILLNKMHQKR